MVLLLKSAKLLVAIVRTPFMFNSVRRLAEREYAPVISRMDSTQSPLWNVLCYKSDDVRVLRRPGIVISVTIIFGP